MHITKFIFTLLMVSHGEQFCFDDAAGYIDVSLNMDMGFRTWKLNWSCGNWPSTGWKRRGSNAMVTVSGCCSRAVFHIQRQRRIYDSSVDFDTEQHVRCAPAVAHCSFHATASLVDSDGDIRIIAAGVIRCNCIPDLIELDYFETNATFSKFEGNVTFTQPVQSQIGSGHGEIN